MYNLISYKLYGQQSINLKVHNRDHSKKCNLSLSRLKNTCTYSQGLNMCSTCYLNIKHIAGNIPQIHYRKKKGVAISITPLLIRSCVLRTREAMFCHSIFPPVWISTLIGFLRSHSRSALWSRCLHKVWLSLQI